MLKKINIGSFVKNNIVEPAKKLKNSLRTVAVLSLGAASLTACKKDLNSGSDSFGNRSTSADYNATIVSRPVVVVSGDITTAVHWTAANTYEINGVVTVRGGGSLEIDPGTFIKSSVNPTGTGAPANGVLVIATDGTIDAEGTPTNPIVFTSRYELDGLASPLPKPGDFGGIIILGDARVNTATGTNNIEGLPATDPRFIYGGTDNLDNRGKFRYVRIEYAGFQLAANIEVNGLTLGGVGSLTQVNNVEVAWGLDDGFEFFGGTVSTSDLVALSNDDDQFDFDLGYQGTLANSFAIANKTSTHSASSGASDSNGAEIDNNPATFTASPVTHPIFSNVRIVGTQDLSGITAPGFKNGITVRRGAELELFDSKVTGYNIGLRIDANATAANTLVGTSSVFGFVSAVSAASGTITDDGGNTFPPAAATAPGFSISTQPFYNVAGFVAPTSYSWAKYVYPVVP
ncbi:hypothetical protein [Pedobacter alluvionis]|uniref:T9SS C-terminal target domain-containing protein n=1 Tax=Pedobacter alluvionis TaxID=475253 RepID=A0A497XRC2_9SPHI|nr:hypothetical protein [Pedobacter alluvionis]RLJ69567.1 hypothetical protein BCL90_5165 [Pedobacter alluvionis]TFB28370.1 hypothetical protein E3V97_23085 [Pedobacter alluvionis]